MLPGIRFLLAAILLSVSILVFGLGAAALLRAAHEEFASNPSWRGTPETQFAQQSETPTLALLRVESPAPAAKPADVPASAVPEASATAPAQATAPDEQVAALSPAPEKTAATTAAAPSTDMVGTETPAPAPSSEPSPAPAASEAAHSSDPPSKPDTTREAKAAATDAGDASKTSDVAPATSEPITEVANSGPPKPEAARPEIAKTESAAAESEAAESAAAESAAAEAAAAEAAKPQLANALPTPETATPAAKIATLGGPAVKIDEPSPTRAAARKAERAAEKEKARAEKKAKARRRLAAQRALAAKLAAAQRAADPFGLALPDASDPVKKLIKQGPSQSADHPPAPIPTTSRHRPQISPRPGDKARASGLPPIRRSRSS